jgi:protein-S-isoprenylcysteine O-methyltransferase Ste14
VQIATACTFSAVWISDSFFLNYSTFPNLYVPLGVRLPAGITILVLAAYLAAKGLQVVFGEEREKPAVISTSVFGVVRHPIYLGELLAYLGLIILNISLAALGVWAVAIVLFHRISRYEERLLLERFGDRYASYMRQVPMWLPGIRQRQ